MFCKSTFRNRGTAKIHVASSYRRGRCVMNRAHRPQEVGEVERRIRCKVCEKEFEKKDRQLTKREKKVASEEKEIWVVEGRLHELSERAREREGSGVTFVQAMCKKLVFVANLFWP